MNSTKEYIQEAMLHDLDLCQHLYTKISNDLWDWKPRENMRSTTELLQYLSFIGGSGVELYINGGFTPQNLTKFRADRDAASNATPADFPELIEKQKQMIAAQFATITDDDLFNRKTLQPWGEEVTLLHALLNNSTKYLTGYRMQLFIYAKLNGAEIGTSNAWRGADAAKKA